MPELFVYSDVCLHVYVSCYCSHFCQTLFCLQPCLCLCLLCLLSDICCVCCTNCSPEDVQSIVSGKMALKYSGLEVRVHSLKLRPPKEAMANNFTVCVCVCVCAVVGGDAKHSEGQSEQVHFRAGESRGRTQPVYLL